MYPLGRKSICRAKGLNFWIVKIADCISPFIEQFYSVVSLKFKHEDIIKFKTNQLLVELINTPESDVLSH